MRPPGPLYKHGWRDYLLSVLPRAFFSSIKVAIKEFRVASYMGWKDPNGW